MVHQFFSRIRKDERGTVAMIFGLMLIPIALFAGVAVDISRVYGVSSFVSSAIDGTALATARQLQLRDMTDAEVQVFAQTRYDALISGKANTQVQYQPLIVVVNRGDETVEISTTSIVNNFFATLAGHDTFTVNETTTVSYNTVVVELAMVLDVTGSMSGTKIDGLKLAANDVVDLMIPDTPKTKSNRIALAPYSAAVNAGSLSNLLTAAGNNSVDDCVIGRSGVSATTDDSPGPGGWLVALDPASPSPDIDPKSGTPADAYSCPDAEVLPLSKNKTDITDRIANFAASGWTAGHLGAAWGWYLVSPNWSSVFSGGSDPVPYDDDDTIKAVLLMTDGSFNTRYLGSAGDTSDDQALATCTNMKNQDVIVYAVAFDAPADAETLLRACASSNTHYFSADSTTELRAAFQEIANKLTSLRLTQ
ncbi:MAG: pilus assembly protein TadG-related protein [Hyphomicrobiaceae bacterium]